MHPSHAATVLLICLFIFVVSIRRRLRKPYRENRIALLSGCLVTAVYSLSRTEVADFLASGILLELLAWQLSLALVGVLVLSTVASSYASHRLLSSQPMIGWIPVTLSGVLLVGALLWVEARWQGMERELWLSMPSNLLLAIGAFIGPPAVFELLWHGNLWRTLPTLADEYLE